MSAAAVLVKGLRALESLRACEGSLRDTFNWFLADWPVNTYTSATFGCDERRMDQRCGSKASLKTLVWAEQRLWNTLSLTKKIKNL